MKQAPHRRLQQVPRFPVTSHGDIPDWAFSATQSILNSLRVVDPLTFFHCLRVGEYSLRLARSMGLNDYQQRVAQFAGTLHDVGKIGIEQQIIHKPGRLTRDEYDRMKSHSLMSAEIVEPLVQHPFFEQVLPGVRSHHERVDGEGYPDRLSGEEIPLVARLILIVDTLDAMAHDRPYRMGMPIDRIYQELRQYAGSQFDENLVGIFLESHPSWSRDMDDRETLARLAPNVSNIRVA